MEEITPELISRMASRIYNEAPQTQGMSTHGLPSSGSLPELPSAPTTVAAMPEHMGGVPVSVGSMPQVAPLPGFTSLPTGASMPSFPEFGSIPGVHNLPSTSPMGSQSYSSASTIPEKSATPGFANIAPASSDSTSGLSGFVRSIRQTNYSGRQSCLDPSKQHGRERQTTSQLVPATGARPLDVPAIREDFPILRQKINGKPLVWFDNAATTQKPQSVIDAVSRFYENDYSNIHRGAHSLAARATDAYEKAREKVQSFLGAASIKEIVFVRGTTEGINLVARTFGQKFLQPGDEIVLSTLEHHAQIVPWQMVAKEKGAILRVIPVSDRGEIMMEEYQRILGPRTKVVALTQASNSLGTILPVEEMTQMAKRYGARVIIDGAQSVAHIPVNIQKMGADFFVFSGHKIFAPTGIGAVYIKEELHDLLPPWQGGGNMIRNVTFEETSYAEVPARFEAGTPSIADAVGLGAALDYVSRIGLPNIAAYEHELLQYATEGLSQINGLRIIGTAKEKVSVISFVLPNRSTEDVGRHLNQEGIAVRSGHHCSQPSLRRFGVESTVRPSLTFYNTRGEVDRLVDAVKRIQALP
jgi:cysteine desulfurase / selenocysteine lyase